MLFTQAAMQKRQEKDTILGTIAEVNTATDTTIKEKKVNFER